MIAHTLAATLGLSITQLPGPISLPAQLKEHAIEVVVQATDSHFVAENSSDVGQLLLIGAPDEGLSIFIQLEPGERVVYPFSRGTLDDLLLEVVSFNPDAWTNTGAVSIATIRASSAGALWVENDDQHAFGWLLQTSDLAVAEISGGLIPSSLLQASNGSLIDYDSGGGVWPEGPAGAIHVPVITPDDDKREGDHPPVIEEKPLPPI